MTHADSNTLPRFRGAIRDKEADFRARGSVVLVAFGDSVTMGATAPGVLEPDLVYHQRLKRMLEAWRPKAVFSVINSGIGGDTAERALDRIERDVLRHRPDLVLVAFGLNDASDDPSHLPRFESSLRAILDRIARETEADAMLLTPPFMAARESDAVADEHRALVPRMVALQTGGHLARYAEAIRAAGRRAGVPVADVYAAWEALAAQGMDTTAMLANGLNHPTGEAHAIAARCVLEAIERADAAARER